MQNFEVNWVAVNAARWWFMEKHNVEYLGDIDSLVTKLYRAWMREHWGVEHTTTSIDVVDEQKYSLFLLRWA